MGLGEIIRYARNQLGMTQKELANEVGCAEVTIRQYEANRREPSYEMCLKLEDALKISLVAHPENDIQDHGSDINIELLAEEIREDSIRDAIMSRDEEALDRLLNIPQIEFEKSILQGGNLGGLRQRLNIAWRKLNATGQKEAVKRIEELTRLDEFSRTAPSDLPETPAEGNTPTTQEKPPEGQTAPTDGK